MKFFVNILVLNLVLIKLTLPVFLHNYCSGLWRFPGKTYYRRLGMFKIKSAFYIIIWICIPIYFDTSSMVVKTHKLRHLKVYSKSLFTKQKYFYSRVWYGYRSRMQTQREDWRDLEICLIHLWVMANLRFGNGGIRIVETEPYRWCSNIRYKF